MRELKRAVLESGVYTSPLPDPDHAWQWARDLISGDPAMVSLIRNRLLFEWMPDPHKVECLDEIISALRSTSSFD
ncbi:MAG: hypothetical protein ACEQR8_03580 [Cypionkella sp.]